MSFADATAVERRGPGVYTAHIQPGWDIFGIANGGYTMTMVARAIGLEAGDRDLASITGYFTNPARPGPVEIDISPVKVGRSFSIFRATMSAEGRPLVTVLAGYADSGRSDGAAEIVDAPPPDLPAPEDCVRAVPSVDSPFPPPFMDKLQLFIHPDDARDLATGRANTPRVRGWFRLHEDEPEDSLAVVLACDAFPPAVFNSSLPPGWTPTFDMTVHIRDPRPRSWLMCQFRTRFVTGGLLEEDGEIWDVDGRLVAQSRQLALVPR